MRVFVSHKFKKNLKKRFSNQSLIEEMIDNSTILFIDNPRNSILKDHALKGKKSSFRAFSVTSDIRIIYQVVNDIAVFLDIGTHNQVY